MPAFLFSSASSSSSIRFSSASAKIVEVTKTKIQVFSVVSNVFKSCINNDIASHASTIKQ